MAFVVNSLPAYVEERKGELLAKTVFGAPTIKHIDVMTGVKYKQALNILSTNPALQARQCGFNASGNATFTQRVMEVYPYMVNMEFCVEDLRQKWMNDQVKTAAGMEVLPFEEKITSEIVANVSRQVEKNIWQATAANEGWDGLLAILDAAGAIDGEYAHGETSAYNKVLAVYKAIPVEVLDKAEIFMGIDLFRDLVLEITAKNLYHYDPKVDEALEIIFPGTSTKVHAVSGLNNSGKIVASIPENLIYGTDMANDAEDFDLWYSKDNQVFRLAIKFNSGAQVAFPDQVVVSKEAAA